MKILAIGNEFRKDDAIALILAEKVGAVKAFANPENFAKEGEEIIIIDAVDFGAEPGSVKEFLPDEIHAFALSTTHNLGVDLLEKFCKIRKIIGIQPKDTGYGKGLSPELKSKRLEILKKVKSLLND